MAGAAIGVGVLIGTFKYLTLDARGQNCCAYESVINQHQNKNRINGNRCILKVGYARVSTVGQSLEEQIRLLESHGCVRIFTEKVTAKNKNHRELNNMLRQITHGDVVLVTRLDRLARNTKDLLDIIQQIDNRSACFQSIKEVWADTTTPVGKILITVLGGIAEFERERILERTNEGRKLAQEKGIKLGRKPKLTITQKEIIRELFKKREKTQKELASDFRVSRSTIQRILKKE